MVWQHSRSIGKPQVNHFMLRRAPLRRAHLVFMETKKVGLNVLKLDFRFMRISARTTKMPLHCRAIVTVCPSPGQAHPSTQARGANRKAHTKVSFGLSVIDRTQ